MQYLDNIYDMITDVVMAGVAPTWELCVLLISWSHFIIVSVVFLPFDLLKYSHIGINARPDEEKTPIARIGTNTNTRPDGEMPTARIQIPHLTQSPAACEPPWLAHQLEMLTQSIRGAALSIDDVADVFEIYTNESALPIKLVCRSCDTRNEPEAAFCIECGRRLRPMRYNATVRILRTPHPSTDETIRLEDERNGG